MWLVVFLAALLLGVFPSSWAHTCMQDSLFDVNSVSTVQQSYADTYPYANNTLPIRMRVDTSYLTTDLLNRTCLARDQRVRYSTNTSQFYPCGTSDVLTSSLRSYLVSLLDQARALFEASLLVIPVDGSLRLNPADGPVGLNGGVYISDEYTTGVPGIDVVIFVTARPIIQDGGPTTTLAVATVVQQDEIKRPVMGHLNINPAGIDVSAAMFKRNFGVVIHEMTHSLGFTISKLRDVNPDPVTVRPLY